MRPIDKGPTPLGDDNQPITVSNHRQWRRYLIDRIGEYCSYCEIRLNISPQIEHVIAQDIDPTLSLSWDNLVLACGPCNRKKSNTPCPPSTHYLPEVHNTYLAFEFFISPNPKQHNEAAAFIKTKENPAPPSPYKANNTIDLCALNEDTTAVPKTVTDLRWRYRLEAIKTARHWRTNWDDWAYKNNSTSFINLLLTTALATGFFSVWFYIFEDVPAIKGALVHAFPGTALDCFDTEQDYVPIWRNPSTEI